MEAGILMVGTLQDWEGKWRNQWVPVIIPPYSREPLAFAFYFETSDRSLRWYSLYEPTLWRQDFDII